MSKSYLVLHRDIVQPYSADEVGDILSKVAEGELSLSSRAFHLIRTDDEGRLYQAELITRENVWELLH